VQSRSSSVESAAGPTRIGRLDQALVGEQVLTGPEERPGTPKDSAEDERGEAHKDDHRTHVEALGQPRGAAGRQKAA
jgi:hypothetical protein